MKKAELHAAPDNDYNIEHIEGVSQLDKSRVIARADAIRRQQEIMNRRRTGGKRRSARKGRKTRGRKSRVARRKVKKAKTYRKKSKKARRATKRRGRK